MGGGVRSVGVEQLLHALTDAVVVLRGDVVADVSPGAERRVGGVDLVGSSIRDLVHPDDVLPSSGRPTAHVRLATPSGGYRWFEVTSVATDDGCLLAVRDVDERV